MLGALVTYSSPCRYRGTPRHENGGVCAVDVEVFPTFSRDGCPFCGIRHPRYSLTWSVLGIPHCCWLGHARGTDSSVPRPTSRARRAGLVEEDVTHVCLESTGSYWKPVYNLLEAVVVVWLINPSHVKPLRGRKTDVKDSQWLAELLAFGLVVPSFIPDKPQRELREAVRYRRSLIEERAREVNRIQKVLEGGNIKLGSVVSDVLGVSGRAMLTALADGSTDPAQLATLAHPRLRASAELLAQALTGVMGDHQRWMLTQQLRHLSDLEALITGADQEIARRTRPFCISSPGIPQKKHEHFLTFSN